MVKYFPDMSENLAVTIFKEKSLYCDLKSRKFSLECGLNSDMFPHWPYIHQSERGFNLYFMARNYKCSPVN